MDPIWNGDHVAHLTRLAGLELDPDECARFARELAGVAAAADRLPPPAAPAGAVAPPVAGPPALDLAGPPPREPVPADWPPGAARGDDGWLVVPPVREESQDER